LKLIGYIPVWRFERLTPTQITLYNNGQATVQYRVVNLSNHAHTLKMDPIKGIEQVTGSGLCDTIFYLSQKGASCILSLLVKGDRISHAVNGGPIVCQVGGGASECYHPSAADELKIRKRAVNTPRLAYFANGGNQSISICSVAADGSLSSCHAETDSSFGTGIRDIIVNAALNKAYIANRADATILICSLDANGSIIHPCTTATPGVTMDFPGLSLSASKLYVTSYADNLVAICSLNADGSIQTPCATSDGNDTFNGPNGRMGFNPGGTHAYIPNYGDPNYISGSISICDVNPEGNFGICTSTANGSLVNPLGAALNKAGTDLYVANGDSTVTICPVDPNDGTLGTCVLSNDNTTFHFTDDVTNLLIDNTIGYVPNDGNNTISLCSIENNHNFGSCAVFSDATFNQVVSVWVNY
jgi:DNA-binding beta-propeller fold protein YncE